MKSRIAVCVFSLAIAILSISLGGCSNSGNESTGNDSKSSTENYKPELVVNRNGSYHTNPDGAVIT